MVVDGDVAGELGMCGLDGGYRDGSQCNGWGRCGADGVAVGVGYAVGAVVATLRERVVDCCDAIVLVVIMRATTAAVAIGVDVTSVPPMQNSCLSYRIVLAYL